MDIEAQRKQYLAEIANAVAVDPLQRPEAVASYAASGAAETERLREMISCISLRPDDYRASVRTLLDILANDAIDTASRLAALRQLGAAEFEPVRFAEFHAEYIELLRGLSVAEDGSLRLAALERLTLTNDAEAQKLLRESLEKGRKPLLPAAKAIQLLARDEHGSATPLFRKLAVEGKGPVRTQALRALASDVRSASLFEAIASNKSEKPELRQIAAMNLRNTSVPRFAKLAANLALDETESDRIRAVAMSAIAHASGVALQVKSPRTREKLFSLGSAKGPKSLRASARRFSKAVGES